MDGEEKTPFKDLICKSGKRSVGTSRRLWVDNMECDFGDRGSRDHERNGPQIGLDREE